MSMVKCSWVAGLWLALLSVPTQASELDRLDWLVGEWRFEDTQVNGEYREAGTRNCERALDDAYILCRSVGISNNGQEREYLWYFNYNRMDGRYEMSALNSAWPRKDLYILEPSEDGRRVDVDTLTWKKEGLVRMNVATISYNGADRYVWEIRSGAPDAETGEHAVTFRDTVTRVAE